MGAFDPLAGAPRSPVAFRPLSTTGAPRLARQGERDQHADRAHAEESMNQRIEAVLADMLVLAGEEPDVISDEVRAALGDLLDGFVLTVLIAVAIGTIYYQ